MKYPTKNCSLTLVTLHKEYTISALMPCHRKLALFHRGLSIRQFVNELNLQPPCSVKEGSEMLGLPLNILCTQNTYKFQLVVHPHFTL